MKSHLGALFVVLFWTQLVTVCLVAAILLSGCCQKHHRPADAGHAPDAGHGFSLPGKVAMPTAKDGGRR